MKEYQQLTLSERYHIRRYKQAGKGINEIARLLFRDRSTISRELRRNTGRNGYQPRQAEKFATSRRYMLGHPLITSDMIQEIETKLHAGDTPAIISMRARVEGREMVSHERIYQHVMEDAARGGGLWKSLPRSHRRRWRRIGPKRRNGGIKDQKMIDQRPSVVEARSRVGDWEGDLVQMRNGHLVSLVERRSRYVLLGRVRSKHERTVRHRLKRMLMSVPNPMVKTLTLDNGLEFAGHQKLSMAAKVEIYFAHPYHAWERGSNENANGLIRRWFPKGSDLSRISDKDISFVQNRLNNRPRACLGYLTSLESLFKRTPSLTWPPLFPPLQRSDSKCIASSFKKCSRRSLLL